MNDDSEELPEGKEPVFLAIIIFGILSARKEYIMDIKVCIGSSCHLRGSYAVSYTHLDVYKRQSIF